MTDPREAIRIELVDDEMAAVLASKTGAERLAIAAGMYRSARRMLESHLRATYPAWDRDRRDSELRRRLAGGTG